MTPRHNVGGLDRWIRLMLGVPLIAAGLFPLGGAHGNVLGLLVALVGLASLVSGITGYCPLYVPLDEADLDGRQGAQGRLPCSRPGRGGPAAPRREPTQASREQADGRCPELRVEQ